jgi:hypothetical protein
MAGLRVTMSIDWNMSSIAQLTAAVSIPDLWLRAVFPRPEDTPQVCSLMDDELRTYLQEHIQNVSVINIRVEPSVPDTSSPDMAVIVELKDKNSLLHQTVFTVFENGGIKPSAHHSFMA